ncbi:haloacid dehalogenase type II [Anaeromyxobacter oryzisoli]|uniref:haloacid dehalogenase type II n=1 Tax=Anaeromyxobacter oryzisoli TaxID=2925408 RepID=UPI001F566799|nr:haloacid dehalogenase type II [Anaeromyxobacter sp. SG63]
MPTPHLPDVQACVFDAYGTLFDVNSAAERAKGALGARWQPLADTWRAKQLQYTWLRSLAGQHVDFWQVTGDALDFALESVKIADPALRAELMTLYLSLAAYPDVRAALERLKARGFRLAVLSNGSPRMLAAAVENAGLADLLDAVLSVEEVGIYKPHPSVYQLPVDRLGLAAGRMCFVSSNGWDAFCAQAFGYRAVWCNRFGQAPERIPAQPAAEVAALAALPDLLARGA